MAVITGDIATTRDADRIGRHGVPALQINTGGGCHIEAHQIARAADDLEGGKLDCSSSRTWATWCARPSSIWVSTTR